MRIIAIIAVVLLVPTLALFSQSSPTVTLADGQLRGAPLDKGGAVFKGIPFAQPPTGALRWREPIPPKPWAGLRDATAFGPACAQKATAIVPNAAEISKEDCLYLNIWTAEWPNTSPKPVMVLIPGGGNFADGSSNVFYDGDSLARRGVVFVSMNYRLGPFGFFSHPSLTRESAHHTSGNQGLLDQIAALQWVQKSIALFGGDRNNVTIIGTSAGSVDVGALMTSPLAKGLFHKAIGQSGGVVLFGEPLSLAQAEQRGQTTSRKWYVAPDATLEALRNVPQQTIAETDPDFIARSADIPKLFPNLGITVDGYALPRKPAEVFASGGQQRIPLLLGSNAREQIPGVVPTDPAELAKAISAMYGPLAGQAQRLYGTDSDPAYGSISDQWATDTQFRCPTVAQMLWHADAKNPVFEYEFARVAEDREPMGTTHASEVSYVFGTLVREIGGIGPYAKAETTDLELSNLMQQYWTNFAKTGNPNGNGLPEWRSFDRATRAYLQFTNTGPAGKEGLRTPYCDLFIENMKRVMLR